MTCIYAIVNTVTHQTYVGATAGSAIRRINLHMGYLRRGKGVSKALQGDWNTYGERAFRGEQLEAVESVTDLPAREAFWIAEMERRGIPLYNHPRAAVYPDMIAGYVVAHQNAAAAKRFRERRRRPAAGEPAS